MSKGELPALLVTRYVDPASVEEQHRPAERAPYDGLTVLDGPEEATQVSVPHVEGAQPSPDGRLVTWIAAERTGAEEPDPPGARGAVIIHELATRETRRIEVPALSQVHPRLLAWDADGSSIAVTTADGVAIIDVASGSFRLHPNTQSGDVLLDVHGDHVVVSRSEQPWLLTPGLPPSQLEEFGTVQHARFSPDRRSIALVIHQDSSGFKSASLVIHGLDGRSPEHGAPFDLLENYQTVDP